MTGDKVALPVNRHICSVSSVHGNVGIYRHRWGLCGYNGRVGGYSVSGRLGHVHNSLDFCTLVTMLGELQLTGI